MKRHADLSQCGHYRYSLTRRWSDGSVVCWIMLNPSTADAVLDDPTIRRCVGFSRRWGFGGLIAVNLFALRATNPGELRSTPWDPVGPANDRHIAQAHRLAQLTVAAWGASGGAMAKDRAIEVTKLLHGREGGEFACIGWTKTGCPLHPGRPAYTEEPMTYIAKIT